MTVDENIVDRTLVGRYRLERCIGRGGMASVYDARIVAGARAGQRAAVKIVHPDLTRDPMVVRRFQREARAIERLSHPNVVEVYEHGVDGDQAFIAMELAAGTDLLQALARENPMPQGRATIIVAQTCQGLEAAHALGIVHRDLKPENIMLVADADGTETVKLLDFGIAKILDTAKTDSDEEGPPSYVTRTALTRVGTIVGTPAYMSPEQCRGGELDGRSDVYACGVLLYQIVTGELPFLGETPLHTAMRHLHAHAREPRLVRTDLHPSLNAIILKSLKKWPAERQQSARQLAEELLAALPQLPDVTPQQVARGREIAVAAAEHAAATHRTSDRSPPNVQLGQARLGQGAALAPSSAMIPSSTLDQRPGSAAQAISAIADTPRAEAERVAASQAISSGGAASTDRKPTRPSEGMMMASGGGGLSPQSAAVSRIPSTPRRTPPRPPERPSSQRPIPRTDVPKATVMTVPLRGTPAGQPITTSDAASTVHPRTLASKAEGAALLAHPTETGLTPTTQFSPNEPRREDEDEAPTFVRAPPDEPERNGPALRTWVMEPMPVGAGPSPHPTTSTSARPPPRPASGPPPNAHGLGGAKTVEASMLPDARRILDAAYDQGVRPGGLSDAPNHASQPPPAAHDGAPGHHGDAMRDLRATARMADEFVDLSSVSIPKPAPSPPMQGPGMGSPPGPPMAPTNVSPVHPAPTFGDISQIRQQPDAPTNNRFADASGVRYPDGSFGPLKSTVRMAPEAATQLPGIDLTSVTRSRQAAARRRSQGKLDELPGSTALLIGVAIGLFLAVAVGLVVYVIVR